MDDLYLYPWECPCQTERFPSCCLSCSDSSGVCTPLTYLTAMFPEGRKASWKEGLAALDRTEREGSGDITSPSFHILSTITKLSSLIHTTTCRGRCYCYSPFVEEDTEAQGKVACSVTYVVSGRIRICTWVRLMSPIGFSSSLQMQVKREVGVSAFPSGARG